MYISNRFCMVRRMGTSSVIWMTIHMRIDIPRIKSSSVAVILVLDLSIWVYITRLWICLCSCNHICELILINIYRIQWIIYTKYIYLDSWFYQKRKISLKIWVHVWMCDHYNSTRSCLSNCFNRWEIFIIEEVCILVDIWIFFFFHFHSIRHSSRIKNYCIILSFKSIFLLSLFNLMLTGFKRSSFLSERLYCCKKMGSC